MHNTHYIVVSGENKEDVISQVETELDNFGDENNWYNIEEVINLENLDEQQKDYVNGHLKDLNYEISSEKVQEILNEIDKQNTKLDSGNRNVYWFLSELYKQLYEIMGVSEKYTIENILDGKYNDFYGYKFDEYGITEIGYEDKYSDETYFVVVDMHS